MAGRGRSGALTDHDVAALRERHFGRLPGQSCFGPTAFGHSFTMRARQREAEAAAAASAAAAAATAATAVRTSSAAGVAEAVASGASAADSAVARAVAEYYSRHFRRPERSRRNEDEAAERQREATTIERLQATDVPVLIPALPNYPPPPAEFRPNIMLPASRYEDHCCIICECGYANARTSCCDKMVCWPCGVRVLQRSHNGTCPYCRNTATVLDPNLTVIPEASLAALARVENNTRAGEAEEHQGPIDEPADDEPEDGEDVGVDADDDAAEVHGDSDYDSNDSFIAPEETDGNSSESDSGDGESSSGDGESDDGLVSDDDSVPIGGPDASSDDSAPVVGPDASSGAVLRAWRRHMSTPRAPPRRRQRRQ